MNVDLFDQIQIFWIDLYFLLARLKMKRVSEYLSSGSNTQVSGSCWSTRVSTSSSSFGLGLKYLGLGLEYSNLVRARAPYPYANAKTE